MNRLQRLTRRQLLGRAGALGAALPLSRVCRADDAASDVVRIAHVGVGGMGRSDLNSVASSPHANIVGLCDIDAGRLAGAAKSFPDARTFADYRRMLDELSDSIDAVVVSTPDHMHGAISIDALRRGKHVYCQKPIAHNLRECRKMTELAEERGLVTQMGTQIHAHEAYRTAVASVRAGAIGKVREAHLWVSKSWAGPSEGRADRVDSVPEGIDWDLWLGVAPERPYVKGAYHPARWRGWRDFGAGTLGDMGCHIFDPVFSALGLGAPSEVVSKGPQHGEETFAPDGDVQYVFPETEWTAGPLKMRWTDGSGQSRPDAGRAGLPDGVGLPGAGSFLVGERGTMVIPHWSTPRIYRDGVDVGGDDLVRMEGKNHYHEWVDACRGVGETSTPFSYSGPLTEAVLAGVVAGCFRGKELRFDAAEVRFDDAAADAMVGRKYRDGFEIRGI